MLCVDVNVLVYGLDASSRHHERAHALLERQRSASELTLLLPEVVSGLLRVMTDRRIFTAPAEPSDVLAFVDALLASPSIRVAGPGPGQWARFRQLVDQYQPRGPETTDVYLAAAALDLGATWVSFDRGFARFRELSWVNPADA